MSGKIYESGLMKIGRLEIGKKSPHKKIIGNRKKFENVCASKTSLTPTAIKSPRKVEAIEIRTIAKNKTNQEIPERSTKNAAIIRGTKALKIPKRIAPLVLAIIKTSSEIGARRSLSKVRFFFSKVTATARRDVVPNIIEIAITPGRIDIRLSNPLPDLIKNIPDHAKGKIIPQLMFGGLR